MQAVVLATHNNGKAREFARLLEPAGIQIKTLADCGIAEVPEETGTTFLENARIKAQAAMKATGLPSLADDSGLCVDALDGAPGVWSAVYGGLTDPAEQIALLLRQMEGKAGRRAAFVCQLVLLYPDGREVLAEGRCEGEILPTPRGDGGFGYDPIFLLPEKGLSMAELPPEEKNTVSHRGIALRKLLEGLT
ncbi:MAG: RdgB/HAM1 family non-canonical purine NTP pyrophosphatase [Oscillospiraceae bacterium]|jgi:XTP/dITP diphosphohydrolase|nr:RdgB/HAM1 family non-canonical purine NTP pyrophosphatase [Oscillospiraceae bacterium]